MISLQPRSTMIALHHTGLQALIPRLSVLFLFFANPASIIRLHDLIVNAMHPCQHRDYKKIASSYDLVVTTYQTLASDYSRQGKNDIFEPLGRIHWVRRQLWNACV